MPVREKRPRSAGSCPARPFSRPSHTQTAAKLRGFSQTAQGFTAETDSPLEGAGFEPSVPRESNGENAKEPVSPLERKMPEMSSTGRRLSIFTSGFSRD